MQLAEAEQRETVTEAKAGLRVCARRRNTNNPERFAGAGRESPASPVGSPAREEIKRYLDDDSDMRDMYLTRRLLAELFGGAEAGRRDGRDGR